MRKGQLVNIPVLFWYVWQHKHHFRFFGLDLHIMSVVLMSSKPWSLVMRRIGLNGRRGALAVLRSIPGDLEKGVDEKSKISIPRTSTGAPR